MSAWGLFVSQALCLPAAPVGRGRLHLIGSSDDVPDGRSSALRKPAPRRKAPLSERVLNLMTAINEPMTPTRIAVALAVHRDTARKLLVSMGRAGEIRRCGNEGKEPLWAHVKAC